MTTSTSDPFKQNQADLQPRDLTGKFSKLDPPLVSFSVTNPLTYIRKWWKAVMEGEGVDIRLKVHPFTAVAIVLAVGGVSFGIGRITVPATLAQYVPLLATPTPSPTISPWRPAAFAGLLQQQNGKFYLVVSSQAILLEVPENVALDKLNGKRILATGQFDGTSTLRVEAASDLKLITGSQPIPTLTPAPYSSASATPEASPTL